MTAVISYLRFSHERQRNGDSFQRQLSACRAWCASRGLALDESLIYRDAGVSAYRGANKTFGALSALLDLIASGRIPRNSYLLIENFDRLTREQVLKAVNLLCQIVESGLTVVTLSDGQEWTAERIKDGSTFVILALLLSRGHAESERKSELVSKAISRARAEKRIGIFGHYPGWLCRESGKFIPIPEKVESIKKVFELTIAGFGGGAISRRANAEKWPVPTRDVKWGQWLPSKILADRNVLGEMQFRTEKTGKRVVLEICPDWYPRVISDEMFYAARSVIDSRKTVAPRTDDHYRNIFKGLAHCGYCGASLLRRNAHTKSHRPGYGRYVCANRFHGLTDCPTHSALDVEAALIPQLYEYYAKYCSTETATSSAQSAIASLTAQLEDLMRSKERLIDAIATPAGGALASLTERLQSIEQSIQAARINLSQQHAIYESARMPDASSDALLVVNSLSTLSTDFEAKEIRARANLKLRRFIQRLSLKKATASVELINSTEALALSLSSDAREYLTETALADYSPEAYLKRGLKIHRVTGFD